jgi:hypothetical protein
VLLFIGQARNLKVSLQLSLGLTAEAAAAILAIQQIMEAF